MKKTIYAAYQDGHNSLDAGTHEQDRHLAGLKAVQAHCAEKARRAGMALYEGTDYTASPREVATVIHRSILELK